MLHRITVLLLFVLAGFSLQAQTYQEVEASRFDYGRMWTFEHPPLDYFEETYGFRPDASWLEKARMSSLRFANWCSASFISPNGLILTNHHCSRGVVGQVMKAGENFDENGFFAASRAEERQVPGLFVKQLVKMEDVTNRVVPLVEATTSAEEMQQVRQQTLEKLIGEYQSNPEWAGLEIEPVVYYNGGRYSLYGYKRYDDIRLVLIPELALGYFGGDPDNFTYPRYNLDFTIWRAYDENGEPLNTSNHYFKINPEGVAEDVATFVIGNPGSTERYRTLAQLEYDRDYRYNIQLERTRDVLDILWAEYYENPDPELLEQIFGLANGEKARTGIIKGMHDPYLMGRKKAMEEKIREQSGLKGTENDYWAELDRLYRELGPEAMEVILLAPNPFGGNALLLTHYWDRYLEAAMDENSSEADLTTLEQQIRQTAGDLNSDRQQKLFTAFLEQLQQFASPDDKYVSKILDGDSPAVAARRILDKTKMDEEKYLDKLFKKKKPEKIANDKDPVMEMYRLLIPEYKAAGEQFQASAPRRRALESKVGGEVYKIYGLDIPPDATFTLRLADGVVKGYEYNGTEAPVHTTYFGLYDRHYSHQQEFPWNLPEKWMDPPMELLKTPLNFVSTNDIIGGNSGSPMINRELELIGLIFDGNIESLPGNFIYESTANRTVSVHAGAIVGSMKYIYEADRLLKELGVD